MNGNLPVEDGLKINYCYLHSEFMRPCLKLFFSGTFLQTLKIVVLLTELSSVFKFMPPDRMIGGLLFLSCLFVCLFVCLSVVNFNIRYNF